MVEAFATAQQKNPRNRDPLVCELGQRNRHTTVTQSDPGIICKGLSSSGMTSTITPAAASKTCTIRVQYVYTLYNLCKGSTRIVKGLHVLSGVYTYFKGSARIVHVLRRHSGTQPTLQSCAKVMKGLQVL